MDSWVASHKGIDERIQWQCVIQCFVRDGAVTPDGKISHRRRGSRRLCNACCRTEYLPLVSPGTFLSGQTAPAPSELHPLVGCSSGFQTDNRKELPISAHKRWIMGRLIFADPDVTFCLRLTTCASQHQTKLQTPDRNSVFDIDCLIPDPCQLIQNGLLRPDTGVREAVASETSK